jgi:hypothetical protein
MGAGAVSPFSENASLVLNSAYHSLHNPDQAGLIPVALGPVTILTPEGKSESIRGLVFDWDGTHYFYHPDWGTYAKSLPANPETGLPYLCVQNGAWMENVYFCVTYLRNHPGEKALLIPGELPATAYTSHGRLCLFTFPFGKFVFPDKYGPEVIADPLLLAKLRDLLVTQVRAQRAGRPEASQANLISDHMPGDDLDMQVRRAFLAFEAAGITSHFNDRVRQSFDFTWQAARYRYGPGGVAPLGADN